MVFSSPIFLFLFLPLTLVVYFLCPRRMKNCLLLLCSLVFYAWGEVSFVLVMLASIVANYSFGICIGSCSSNLRRRLALACAILTNLGMLFAFKYAGFFVQNLNAVLSGLNMAAMEMPSIHLPLGISFFTFQSLSYVIDVYRRDAIPQKNPVNLALFIAMFPQLIAGPIVRYTDIAVQIARRQIQMTQVAAGIRRFIIGLGKKILIANTLGLTADAVFQVPHGELTASVAWLGVLCYALQIYFDFSGYSDMAIGLGRMFGFKLRENFNYPYIASSITEFWRRWHISLSTWFRDYVYIPLGGNRESRLRTYRNLVLVFILCGLWHGASWNFVAWGLLHGSVLIFERVCGGRVAWPIWKPAQHAYVLLVVLLGWVFFRTENLSDTFHYLSALAGVNGLESIRHHVGLYTSNGLILAGAVGVMASTPMVPWLRQRLEHFVAAGATGRRVNACWLAGGHAVRLAGIAAILLASVAVMSSSTHNPFIYFRF